MGWSLHLDLPRQWIASPPGAEADVFEEVKRHRVRTGYVEPDALQEKLLAAKVEYTQQKSFSESKTAVLLMHEDRQLRFGSSLGRTEHCVAHNAVADYCNKLIETLFLELSQPPTNLGFATRRQSFVFAFRLELKVHGHQPPVVVAHHFPEHGLHGLRVEHCKYHADGVSGKSPNALIQRYNRRSVGLVFGMWFRQVVGIDAWLRQIVRVSSCYRIVGVLLSLLFRMGYPRGWGVAQA